MATRNLFGDLALDTSVTAVKTSVDAVKTKLDTGITVSLDSTSLSALESITAVGPLTDTQLRATPIVISDGAGSITVDGTVSISGSVPVTGTFWQTTQPVSLANVPLATGASTSTLQTTGNTSLASIDTKLSGSISVTGPLTDIQLRATALPVSATTLPLPTGAATQTTLAAIDTKLGSTLTVTGTLTDTQLRATPVPVSISGSIPVTIASAIEITNDVGNAIPVSGTVTANAGTGFQTNALTDAQLRATAVPVSGSVTLNSGTAAIGKLTANDGIDIGDVTINNASLAVTGTFWQATQPISAAALPLPTGAATATLQSTGNTSLAAIDTKLGSTLTVNTGLSQGLTDAQLRATAVPVSGTLTVNTGLTDAQLRATPIVISDGAGSITVDGTVELGATSLAALENTTVTLSGTVPLPTGAATNAKLDEVITAVSGISGGGSGGLTDTQLRASPLNVSLSTIPLATGAATNAKLDEVVTAISGISGGGPSGGLTDVQLRASPVVVSSVTIEDLVQQMADMTAIMMQMLNYMKSLGNVDSGYRQRVAVDTMPTVATTVSSGTLTTVSAVTAVTTVNNTAQVAGFGLQQFQAPSNTAYNTGTLPYLIEV